MNKHHANDADGDSASQKASVNKGRISIIDKLIGLQIKKYRTDANLTQAEIGRMINVKYQQIQKFETGENRIAASQLVMISVKSGKSMEYFVSNARAYIEHK